MRFIAKSPSAARPARAARVFGYPVARIPQKWTPVLRKEYAQFKWLEHFLTANRIPLCLKMLDARIWRSYTAKAGRCHPSVAFFGRFWLTLMAHRSGRLALVRASASA